MNPSSSIYIAGHTGLVGSAIVRKLTGDGFSNLILRTHAELDLERQEQVEAFFEKNRPEYVILAAARVGGIWANTSYPVDFISSNLAIQTHILRQAWKTGVRRLLFLGSSCIYPRQCPQPIKEEYLLTGPLEMTNRPYAVAKISGIVECEAYNRQYGTRFLSLMPTNLYGPHDNFDLETSHVLPALIRKFHLAGLVARGDREAIRRDEARFGAVPEDVRAGLGISGSEHPKTEAGSVLLWGTGMPMREFLHVDDLAQACLFLLKMPEERLLEAGLFPCPEDPQPLPLINVGYGEDQTIAELAEAVKDIVGFNGKVIWDRSKPDGTPRKLLDTSLIRRLGWKPAISMEEGIRQTYAWYVKETGR